MSKPSRRHLATAILNLLAESKSPASVAQQVAHYLIAERRTRELEALMRDVQQQRQNRDGISEAEAISAHTLTDAIKHQIQDVLQAPKVLIDFKHDPEVIGGVRVRSLDKQLDISVEHKLTQLKQMSSTTA